MKTLLLLLGLLITGFFFYYCISNHAPEIQEDIRSRVVANFAEQNLGSNDILVDVSGRDVVLTGNVASQEIKDRAGKAARDLYGVRVVDNRLNVIAPPPPAPEPIPEPIVEAIPEPVVIPEPEPVAIIACQEELAAIVEAEKINFDSSRSTIKSESIGVLDRVVAAAKACSDSIIHVHGHTDSTGNAAFNQELSVDRASAVAAYLASNGVRQRLRATGHGSNQPIASNDNAVGRAANRRIEFKVYKPEQN